MTPLSRRAFLQALTAAPLVGTLAACSTPEAEPEASPALDRPGTLGEPDQGLGEVVTRPEDAIDVFDMRVTAERRLPPAHYGYIAPAWTAMLPFVPTGAPSTGSRFAAVASWT